MSARGRLWLDLAAWVRPYALHATGYVVLMALGAALGLVTPFMTGHVIDALVAHRYDRIPLLVAEMLGATTLVAVAQFLRNQCSGAVARSINRDLSRKLFMTMQRAPLEFFRATTPGEMINVLRMDVDAVTEILYGSLFPAIFSISVIVSTVVSMLTTNVLLSLVSFITIPLWLLATWLASRTLVPMQRKIRVLLDEHNAVVSERLSIGGIIRAKTNVMYGEDLAAYERCLDPMTQLSRSLVTAFGVSGIAAAFLAAAGPGLLLLIGTPLVSHGQTTVGTLTIFMALLARLFEPVGALASINTRIPRITTAHDRITRTLHMPTEPSAGLEAVRGTEIAFAEAGLRTPAHDVLSGVDVAIQPGEHVAVIGASGSGKTTLTHVVLRLAELTSGHVTFGGVPLADYAVDTVRDRITYVPDTSSLFQGTLSENVAYGADAVTPEKLRRIMALVELEAVVERHGAAMDMPLGIGGAPLSAGERQRVMLARALLRERPVYIFDEATSAIDIATEARILVRLRAELEGRTVIFISHRIGSLSGFPRVLVMQGGRLVDDGDHATVTRSESRLAEAAAV